MRSATIYERKEKLYVCSRSKTTVGAWIGNDAPVLAPNKENVAEIGGSIRQCLEASRQGVPHPTSWTNLFKPVLDLAGIKSINKFNESAKCVGVDMVDGTVTLIPMRNEGPKMGFARLPSKIQIPLGSDEALGEAALAALALAV